MLSVVFLNNFTQHLPFKFLPIEPPRPNPSQAETYARRQHHFPSSLSDSATRRKPTILDALRNGGVAAADLGAPSPSTPHFSLDARLPTPTILTCKKAIPLRLLVKRLNASDAELILLSLRINLTSTTIIRTQDAYREESTAWTLVDKPNLRLPVGNQGAVGREAEGVELPLDPVLWRSAPLPSSVAPSFNICNMARRYELEIKATFGHGEAPKTNASTSLNPAPVAIAVCTDRSYPPGRHAAPSSACTCIFWHRSASGAAHRYSRRRGIAVR